MKTLGETFREQRQALGLTIEQAEAATRVRARLLEALENDDLERLPDPGYVKGYVWSYAKFLELDPTESVEAYKRQVGDLHKHDVNIRTDSVVASRKEAHTLPWRTALIAAGLIAVIGLISWAAFGALRNTPDDSSVPLPVEATETAPPPSKKTTTSTEQAPPVESSEPTTEGATTPTPVPFTVTVRVEDGSRSWLRVTVDGKTEYEGILEADTLEYEVANEASVRIGAPSVVTVLKDGEPVAIPENASTPVLTLSASEQ
jgi:cytoskeletal protein RodZ